MTDHACYIGDLNDPSFSWDDGDWSGNVPKAITHGFPDESEAFSRIIKGIEDLEFDGKQTDFGGWVARMTKKEILELIDKWYPPGTLHPYENSPFMQVKYDRLMKLLPELEALDDKKVYAVVAWEL